ncbi:MAG: hypothetical protein ACJ8FT_09265, partial [Sphingomonas sp.]
LRHKRWYKIEMMIIVLCHLIALIIVDWSFAANWNGLLLGPFIAADLAVTMLITYGIFRWLYGPPETLFLEPEPDYRN